MARPTKPEQLKIQERCYRYWAEGKSHTDIARLAEVNPDTVTKYVRKFLAAQPIASMSREEREAAIFAEWAEIGQRMRADMEIQRLNGRVKVVRTQHPDGSETIEQSVISGVDPQLYRALGAHLDRKARQLLDQTPVSEVTNVLDMSCWNAYLGQPSPAAQLETAAVDVVRVEGSKRPGLSGCTE